MSYDKTLELRNFEILSKGVEDMIKTTGIRGLDVQKAKELGFFNRIANLLSLMSVTANASNVIYGHINYLLSEYGIKKHEIKRNCVQYEEALDKFIGTWIRGGYFTDDVSDSFRIDTDELYHLLMMWARLPEVWQLGEPQKVSHAADAVISIDLKDRLLNLFTAVLEREPLREVQEEWCVTKFDIVTKAQTTVHTGMCKADAQVVAKRLSAEDPDNLYTASILRTKVERIVEAVPMKAYKGNKVVGNAKK